jgi:hypothetical protein
VKNFIKTIFTLNATRKNITLRRDLDSERAAMARIWKKREQQIERVTLNMIGMCGELQAIAQESLPQLEDIATLPLPDDDIGASE